MGPHPLQATSPMRPQLLSLSLLCLLAPSSAAQVQGPGLGNLTYDTSELFTSISVLRSNNGHGMGAMVNGYLMLVVGLAIMGLAIFNLVYARATSTANASRSMTRPATRSRSPKRCCAGNRLRPSWPHAPRSSMAP